MKISVAMVVIPIAALAAVRLLDRGVYRVCAVARETKPAATSPPAGAMAGETVWLVAGGLRLKTKVYHAANVGNQFLLVVVLHGDSPFQPPSYQYEFARVAASQIGNLIIAAPLRPGYCDDTGDCSSGKRGLTTGDNYTPGVVDAVAQAVEQLRGKYHAAKVVLVGHSGGAAITGDLLGRWPSKVNGALLVACPCDLAAWRKHMFETRGQNPIWLRPVRSLSPMDLAENVSERVHVRLLVGSEDTVAPPQFSKEYAEALKKRGVDVILTIAPKLEHDILLEPIAFEQLKALLENVEKKLGTLTNAPCAHWSRGECKRKHERPNSLPVDAAVLASWLNYGGKRNGSGVPRREAVYRVRTLAASESGWPGILDSRSHWPDTQRSKNHATPSDGNAEVRARRW